MPCSYSVTSEDTADFISTYSALPEQLSAMTGIECIDFVSRQFAVLHIPMDDLERPMNFSYYTYSAIPKLYSLLATDSMEASGILPASRIPAFGNQGQGVLIGFVDTGIDYQNPLFRKEDGSSRILGIWDQTLETGAPDPVTGFQALYGTQYSREEIDQALAAPDPPGPGPVCGRKRPRHLSGVCGSRRKRIRTRILPEPPQGLPLPW